MQASKVFTVTSIALVIFLGILFLLGPSLDFSKPDIKNATLIKSSAATPLPHFELTDSNGNVFTEQKLRGYWTLMFFGYTDCPDICPATLSVLRETWNKHFPNGEAPVNFVFASVNPGKDDTQSLKNFVTRFHPEFMGVSGQQFEMQKLSHHLGIFAKQQEGVSPAGGPLIDHTAALMLINPQTKLKAILTPPFDPSELANDLVALTK